MNSHSNMASGRVQSQNFLGFIPAMVASYLNKRVKAKQKLKFPDKESFKSVVMFADISGFTNLSERLSQKGSEGPELLAFALNRYMELLVKGIGRSGGDIFKFAGDAMIVLWPPPPNNDEEELTTLCRQAIQSALDIQKKLTGFKVVEDVKLSVKIGFGVGDVTILHVGGVFNRAEYIAAGDPLVKAFACEHLATSGGVCIISDDICNRINKYFVCEEIPDHSGSGEHFYYVRDVNKNSLVRMKADALLMSNNLKPSDIEEIRPFLKSYLPAAVVPFVEIEQESWAAELRKVTVLFINLGIDLSNAKTNEGLLRIQTVIETVQNCVYRFQGSLNKLLMDDKGSTLLVVFGLPPMAHQDDPVRGVVAGMQLVKDLSQKNCKCSVGITTGSVYAGVVGTSGNRREYSILGDSVNLAARFMQMACSEKENKVLVDVKTKEEAEYVIGFTHVKTAQVKGKTGDIEFFAPLELEDNSMKCYPLNIRTHKHTPLKVGPMKEEALLMIGFEREKILKLETANLQKFLASPSESQFVLFSGTYGIGKSLMLRNIFHQVRGDLSKAQWKNEEHSLFLVSRLDCIQRAKYFNGWRNIIKDGFNHLAKRRGESPDGLFEAVLKMNPEIQNCSSVLKDILCLNALSGSPPSVDFVEDNFSELKKACLFIFRALLEEDGSNPNGANDHFVDFIERKSTAGTEEAKAKGSEEQISSASPLIVVLEDMHSHDLFSWKFTKSLLKHLKKLYLVGTLRTDYCELQITFKTAPAASKNSAEPKASDKKEEIPLHKVVKRKLADIERFFQDSAHRYRRYVLEALSEQDTMKLLSKSGGDTVLDDEFRKPLLCYLNSKAGNRPLDILEAMEQLKAVSAYTVKERIIRLRTFFNNLLTMNEFLTIESPSSRVKINGPIIDRLASDEIIIMKAACVIGEYFDLKTLSKVQPLKALVNDNKLAEMLEHLVDQEFLEVLDQNDLNTVFRFMNPFMRECLYNRMIFLQKRQIHRFVAEAMQSVVLPMAGDFEMERKRLEYHWALAEGQTTRGESTNEESTNDSFSHKAKRSIIVKKISSDLSNPKFQSKALKKGFLGKMSDQGISWSNRYCVLSLHKLSYTYEENDPDDPNEVPNGSIVLKHIYNIMPLDEKKFKRKHAFVIYTGSWFKKNREMGMREFYFSAENNDELEEWKTFIEFLRAKSIYDDFVNTFGKISFPLQNNSLFPLGLNQKKDIKNDRKNRIRIPSDNSLLGPNMNSSGSHGSIAVGSTSRASMMRKTKKSIPNISFLDPKAVAESVEAKKKLKEQVTAFIFSAMGLMVSHCVRVACKRGLANDDFYVSFGASHPSDDKFLSDSIPKELIKNANENKLNPEGNSSLARNSRFLDLTRKRSISEGGEKSEMFKSPPPQKTPEILRNVLKTKTIALGDKSKLEAIKEEDFSTKSNLKPAAQDYEIFDEEAPGKSNEGLSGRKPGTVRIESDVGFKYRAEAHPGNHCSLNYGALLTNDPTLRDRLASQPVSRSPRVQPAMKGLVIQKTDSVAGAKFSLLEGQEVNIIRILEDDTAECECGGLLGVFKMEFINPLQKK